ncbi:MAG: F-box protein [Legionella sp.]|nr:F-box protein [Legionella sp.]
MEHKFEFFSPLPQEIKNETVSHLSTPDLLKFSVTSQGNKTFLKPVLEKRRVLQKFIHHVVRGEHDAVKNLLKKDIWLLAQRDQVTDYSTRTYQSISGFEYSLWALDKHMWAAMMSCIPQNKQGLKVFVELLAQYNKVSKKGITYTLHGNIITEPHFDFEILIKALRTQINLGSIPHCTVDRHWQQSVGGAQKLLPMHVVDEYCSREPFYPLPQFTAQPKSSRQYYDWVILKDMDWFGIKANFAICKGTAGCIASYDGEHNAFEQVAYDLNAMTVLYEKRTHDFLELKTELEAKITENNSIQATSIKLS